MSVNMLQSWLCWAKLGNLWISCVFWGQLWDLWSCWIWRMLEVSDLTKASSSWFGYGHWSFIHLCSKVSLSILILKVQRTSISCKSSFGALEGAGGCLLWFGMLILIWIWSLVFDIPMIQILALHLDFEGAKNIHVLKVLICGFGGRWMFPTAVWHLDFDLDMVVGLWYTHDPCFGFVSPFWRFKEHICLLSP